MKTYDQIILFDGVCNLCNGLVNFIIKKDHKSKFKFCALQSSQGKLLLQKFNLDADEINTIVFINGDKCLQKSTAVLNIFYELGGIWKIFYIFIIIPPFIRNFVYGAIAKSRYRIFGKRNACMFPSEEIRNRFIE
jgi:predicted DCC family thiol-disulfide oxidoreductase YuxK